MRKRSETSEQSGSKATATAADDVRGLASLSPGAVFRKADLHVHTPTSPDMHARWKTSTPEDVVEQALASGLEVVAITDHNSAEWCDAVRHAAIGTSLAVFPGVEISTSEGHLLAIFDPSMPGESIKELLIRCGIGGDAFGKPEALAKGRMDDVAKQVEEAGGIAIAAHVDQPKGFWTLLDGSRARRQELYSCPSILAVEVVSSEAVTGFRSGDVGDARRLPCVQGSDSWPESGDCHHLDAIGNRHCFIKLDELSIDALRQTLLDPALGLQLSDDERLEPEAVIEGISVSGGFLDGQRLRFSDNISCLIGGTGAGKSLTLELIRFAADQQTSTAVLPKISEEVGRLLLFALGDAANVRMLVRKSGDRYLIERAWQAGEASDPVVYRVSDGEVELVEEPLHLPSFFPVKGFSQGEVIEHAREPLARLSLIDDLIDVEAEHSAIKDLKSKLRENAKAIVETLQTVENARPQVKDLPGIREQIKALGKFFKDPRVKGHEGWYEERDALEVATEQLSAFVESLDAEFPWLEADWAIPASSPNKDEMRKLSEIAKDAEAAAEKGQEDYRRAMKNLQERLSALRTEWAPTFEDAEREYQRLLTELDKDRQGLPSLNQKLTRLREKESRALRTEKQIQEKLSPLLQSLEKERDESLDSLQAARLAIRKKRKEKAKELTKRLDDRVRITVRGEDDDRLLAEALGAIRVGSHIQDAEVKTMAAKLHPIPLVKSIRREDFEGPAKESGLSEGTFERLRDTIHERGRLEDLYEIQLVDLEDVIRIQFAVEKQEYRDLEALAHGQKCTVVLMVALAEGDSPLIVDQPEDALHAPWIEEYIVARLRGDRGTRQCLFATRSGNVLVSADAEQVIAMDADAHAGKVGKTGALDRFETRELVLYHVEGGREAFERRKQKYGF